MYIFTSAKPNSGEDYRVALARMVTTDLQFSRAIVNYIWAQFFARGAFAFVAPLCSIHLGHAFPRVIADPAPVG